MSILGYEMEKLRVHLQQIVAYGAVGHGTTLAAELDRCESEERLTVAVEPVVSQCDVRMRINPVT